MTDHSRRRFLSAAGPMLALPAFESLLTHRRIASGAEIAGPRPKRVVFLGFGYGVTNETWFPDINQTGAGYALPEGLKPLERHKSDFTVIQGLTNQYNNEAHWGSTFWLTGANRYSRPGQSFHNSISADQVAAAFLGADTRFSSIQLGSEDVVTSGHGPGLSLAWDARGKPISGQDNPVSAFHRMFSADSLPLEQRQAKLAQRRSVLDAVLSDAKRVERELNRNDADKLDEYFQSIRDIEVRLSKEEQWLSIPKPGAPLPEPQSGLAGRDEIKMMYDLIVAAFKTDSTRVITYRQRDRPTESNERTRRLQPLRPYDPGLRQQHPNHPLPRQLPNSDRGPRRRTQTGRAHRTQRKEHPTLQLVAHPTARHRHQSQIPRRQHACLDRSDCMTALASVPKSEKYAQ